MAMIRRHGAMALRQRGFSLVELMVANLIGLIVALALLGSVLTIGRQLAIVGSSVAAQGNAQVALAALDTAASAAGAGLYNNGKLICRRWNAWNGTATVGNNVSLMPARILDGGNATTSDTIVFTGVSGNGAMATVPVVAPTTGANIKIGRGGNFAVGDVAVIGVPGSDTVPCTLFTVTTAPAASPSGCDGNASVCDIVIRAPNQGLNPNGAVFASEPTYGFTSSGSTYGPAVVAKLGSATGFRQEAFTVKCNALVRYNGFTTSTPSCNSDPLSFGTGVDALATDVVQMHAQYGVSASAGSDVVAQWVDASGTTWGGTPTPDDVARIKALRVVVVTRARQPDADTVSTACTNANGVANTGPCSFQDASAPVIDLSATPVAAGRTWQNYRYRVLKAVIPLKTVIWSD
jgi:type IV pilus assembly protein PilW